MANTVNNPSGGSVDGGGARPLDWAEISKNILNNQGFPDQSKENQPVVNAVAYQPVVNLSPEEKFYESLGLKSSMFSPLKSKGRLLVLVVLVGGYFAYKKFKK